MLPPSLLRRASSLPSTLLHRASSSPLFRSPTTHHSTSHASTSTAVAPSRAMRRTAAAHTACTSCSTRTTSTTSAMTWRPAWVGPSRYCRPRHQTHFERPGMNGVSTPHISARIPPRRLIPLMFQLVVRWYSLRGRVMNGFSTPHMSLQMPSKTV